MEGGHAWWKYVYDEHYHYVLCQEYKVLTYRTTNRECRSDSNIYVNCVTHDLHIYSKNRVKSVLRHV